MKYEIKGTYKFIMMLVLAVLGASTGLQLSALRGMKGNLDNFPTFLPLILGLVIFGAFVSAFFYIVSSFRKELYEDRGYLTFSLPLIGKQVLGAKLCIALLWSAILGLSIVIYNLILGSLLFGTRWIEGFKMIFSYISANIVLVIGFTAILSGISTLLLIYFAMTLSKVSIRNKKIGGLWFILFLVLSGIISYITAKVSGVIPYYIDLNTFKIISKTMIGNQITNGVNLNLLYDQSMSGMVIQSGGALLLNIGAYVFSIVVALATFFGTSYLLDKKVEI
jgi:hypothetical protein